MPSKTASQAARPNDQKPSRPQSGSKNAYLLAYNAVSAALWAGVLYNVVLIGGHEVGNARKASMLFGGGRSNDLVTAVQRGLGSGKVYKEMEAYTRVVQSLAGMEVLHSLFGIVRAPLLTTLMQVSSRFLLVHLIAAPWAFPQSTRHSPAYSTMLLAWSVTEVIRYTYFVLTLSGLGVPRLWTWLRYNTFTILYPLGIASECWLVYSAISLASQRNQLFGYALWAILGVYVPGSYILFSHMLAQRRKVGRANKTV